MAVWSETLPDGRTVSDAVREALRRKQMQPEQGGFVNSPTAPPAFTDPQADPIQAKAMAAMQPSSQAEPPPSVQPPVQPDVASKAMEPPDRRIANIGGLLPQATPDLQALLTKRHDLEQLPETNPAKGQPGHIGRWGGFRRGIQEGLQEAAQRGMHGAEALTYAVGRGAGGAIDRNDIVKDERTHKLAKFDPRIQQQLGLEKQQAATQDIIQQAAQRGMQPAIAQAELERKTKYDNDRLDVQRKQAQGMIDKATADRAMRNLDYEERKRHNTATEEIQRNKPIPGQETQKDLDKQDATRRSALQLAATRRGFADGLHKKAQEAYTQLSQEQAKLRDLKIIKDDPKTPADEGNDSKMAYDQQVAVINGLHKKIGELEKERDAGYADAGRAEAEAVKYERPTRVAQPAKANVASSKSGGTFNLKGWITDHPKASQAEIQSMRAKAKARGLSVVE